MTASTDLAVPRQTRPGTSGPSPRQAPPQPLEGSPELLRSVFRQHAAGVAVITAQGARPVGFTATSLNSVAADPPMISFGVGTGSSSWPVLAEAGHVGVHILAEDQRDLAATFARSGADRFAPPTRWRTGPEGVPLLDGVLAWLVCRVVARVPAGDHRIVLGQVVAGDPSGAGRPLLYHQGRFNALRD
ncbi:flavin reductase family protein [Streptomyces chryseus]